MSYTGRVLTLTIAFLLIGTGIWANLGDKPFRDSRGVWFTQAMRGMASY